MEKLKLIWIKSNRKISIRFIITIFCLIGLLVLIQAYTYSDSICKGIAKNIIRLHVIANSNSVKDQEIKYKVRDEILKYIHSQGINLNSSSEVEKFITNHFNEIKNIAKNVLKANNLDYDVKTYLGWFPFPTKMYGDIALPAGEYRSLRVVLGKGLGENWWCVMFPPLCFIDVSQGVVPDSSKTQLQNILSKEEYKVITCNSTNAEPQIKIKFKIVELFQKSKIKLASLLKR